MKTARPYAYPLFTTALFGTAIFFGVIPRESWSQAWQDHVSLLSKVLLTFAFLVLGAWFVHAFTRADQEGTGDACLAEQRASMFRFAYMFSVFSFALLVLPFTAMLRTDETRPDAGPIRLLRACVEPAAGAASAGVAAPLEQCPATEPASVVSYPWLVSVGGVVARKCETGDVHCSGDDDDAPSRPPLYRVQGGLVVPFYVVVFAFVGGVVNLTRRIPEYQKRSSCHFPGTATESRVTLLEAREFVVFQLMQLVTSPFIAMVAFYALEPKSVASAVALAFFSGFSTEWVLLLLRGMFTGIHPATTQTADKTGSGTARLHVVVRRPGGALADKASVELKRLPGDPAFRSETLDASGEVEFKALPAGTLWVVASLANAGAAPPVLTATAKAQLKAGETESLELTLS